VLAQRTEDLEAASRLSLIRERLRGHLRSGDPAPPSDVRDRRIARQLRGLLDARIQPGITLAEAAELLHSHPTHLVRAFSREYGLPPHLYLTGRRVELARRHLLAGTPAGAAAVLAGFYDQAHLTRHFKRMLGVSPGRYADRAPAG
jgi:AraC-like DNA-binding protein